MKETLLIKIFVIQQNLKINNYLQSNTFTIKDKAE